MSTFFYPVNPWRVPEVGFGLVDGVPLTVTMISCVQREHARSLTWPQFEAVGLWPEIFLSPCNPAGYCGNAKVTHEAVEYAREQDASLLFLEDDVDINSDFLAFLGEAMRRDVLTYFYTHDEDALVRARFTPDLAERVLSGGKDIPHGLYKRRRPQGGIVEGSQAVFIPKGLVEALKTQYAMWIGQHRGLYGCWSCDVTIQNSALQTGYWPHIALRNPVQHRHDRTARNGVESITFKKSLTFDTMD